MRRPASSLDSSSRGGWSLALRIARRDATQAVGRSALIVVLILIPVLGLAGLATVVTSMIPTTAETIRAELGNTQARITMVTPPDPSLVQSPNTPWYNEYETNADGPVHHTEGDPLQDPETFLAGERILSIRETSATIRTSHGVGSLAVVEGEPWDPAFAGKYEVLDGRAPKADDEVMASPAALTRLGAKLGDRLAVELPIKREVTVVGTLRDLTRPSSADQLFARPAALDGVRPADDLASTAFYLPDTVVSWQRVQELNAHGAVVLSRAVLLNPPGPDQVSIPVQPPDVRWSQLTIVIPLAGFALFEVVLLAGAAFMVGTRQQQRALATLASVGGDKRMLFRVIALNGALLGVAGGIIGTGLGIVAAWLYIRLTADGSITQYPGFHLNPLVLGGVVVFAALAGLIAAAIPARAAARLDVVQALRNASRPRRVTRRRPTVGIVLVAVGAGLTLVGGVLALARTATGGPDLALFLIGSGLVVLGPVLMQLGAMLIAPLLLHWIARLFAHLGVGARLASRDVSRNASRSVPALAAIMTTVFVGSFVMSFVASTEAQTRANWEYWTPVNVVEADLRAWVAASGVPSAAQLRQVSDALESTFAGTAQDTRTLSSSFWFSGDEEQTRQLFAAARFAPSSDCPNGITSGLSGPGMQPRAECTRQPYVMDQRIWVGTPADLAAILGEPVSERSRKTLASGGAVSLYPEYIANGEVNIQWHSGAQLLQKARAANPGAPARQVSLPATLQQGAHDYNFGVFLAPATAKSIGLDYGPGLVLAPVGAPATDAQYDSLRAAAQAITGSNGNGDVILFRVEPGPPGTAGLVAWALMGVCALIVLGAASVALGLARSDGRRDEYILAATGAAPELRRSFGFWQALCLAGVGSLIGGALGMLPVLALSQLSPLGGGAAMPFSPPWLQLAVAVLVIPLVIAAGSWFAVRTARRPSWRAP